MTQSANIYQPNQMSASGIVKTGSGVLGKILCTTSSTCVVDIYDNTAASGTKPIAALSMTAGQVYDLSMLFVTGCYINITSGSGSWTALYI